MANALDYMADLVKRISNAESNHYFQNDVPLKNNKLEFQNFNVYDTIPYTDYVHKMTHIKSSDDYSDDYSNNFDESSFKREKNEQETEDFFDKVHFILNHGKKVNKANRNNNNKNNYGQQNYLSKEDLADIFEDTNFNERKFYKNPEKNFRQGNKNVPKHLIPFWDNRTIVDCDKKQIFTYNYSLNSNSKPNFVQLRKSDDFLWKCNRKINQKSNNNKKTSHNVLIYDCSSPKTFCHSTQSLNNKLDLSKNAIIFSRESHQKKSKNSNKEHQKNEKDRITKNKNNSTQNKSHQNNLVNEKSHQKNSSNKQSNPKNSINKKSHQNNLNDKQPNQKNSINKKSHQKNSNDKQSNPKNSINKKPHHNNSNNKPPNQENSIDKKSHQKHSIKNNSTKIIKDDIQSQTKEKKKIFKNDHISKDPIIHFSDDESDKIFEEEEDRIHNQTEWKNELYIEEEEEEAEEDENSDPTQIYKYRDVKKMKINMKQISDDFDPILEKLSFDDKNINEKKELNHDFDPLTANENDLSIHDPKFYFKNHPKNKKFDELCSFDISEIPNKLFHIRRNHIIHNPNEFDIIEYNSDDF